MSTEVYHIGNLAVDRKNDPQLDALAEDYLERGTPVGKFVRPPDRHGSYHDVARGRGEGTLTQKRLWPEVYEYRFTTRP